MVSLFIFTVLQGRNGRVPKLKCESNVCVVTCDTQQWDGMRKKYGNVREGIYSINNMQRSMNLRHKKTN